MDTRLLDGRRLHLWLGTLLTLVGCAADGKDPSSSCVTDKPDAGNRCSTWTVNVLSGTSATCGFGDTLSRSGSGCQAVCGASVDSCTWSEGTGGASVRCSQYLDCVVDGRRPEHLEAFEDPTSGLAGWFARMAFYEAASIDAFAILERELLAHGAPLALVRAAARARRDEVIHRDMAVALAERFGASDVRLPQPMTARAVRSLRELALDNAREGCARETLGVAVGLEQAEHAAHPAVRAFYARIARDEARHAAFSWRLHRWLGQRLTQRERDEVTRAVRGALAAMTIPVTSLQRELGMPTTATLHRLADAIAAAA